MTRPAGHRLLAVALVAAMVGCATPRQVPVVSFDATSLTAQREARDLALSSLPGWQFSGRVKIEGNERPTSAEILWIKRDEESRITLSGPAGIQSSTVQVSPSAVVLRRADGEVIRAATPDQLIEKLVGWPMPLSLMGDWVLGLAGPSNVLSRDSQAQLEGVQYREWSGRMSRYKAVGALTLPHRVDVTDGHLRVRITIRGWQLLDTGPESDPETGGGTGGSGDRILIPGIDV